MGYTITAKLSERKALENDTDFFHHIALKFFKVINWYSFKPQDQKNGKYVHFFLPLYNLANIACSIKMKKANVSKAAGHISKVKV